MPSLWVMRIALSAVWFYQGLWCKLLDGAPAHRKIANAVPLRGAETILRCIGIVECAIALWILSGRRAPVCAAAQTVLLVSMNVAGILWARRLIGDVAGMVLQNITFLLLAWVAAGYE